MNDALVMGRLETFGDLATDVDGVLESQGAVADTVLERFALDEGHRDERLAACVIDLMDWADAGVVQSGGGLGFTQKALLRLLVIQQMSGKKLEGDGAFKFGVLGLVNHAHAALAEFVEDLVVADALANHDRLILPLRRC